jgi:hypothetical protein
VVESKRRKRLERVVEIFTEIRTHGAQVRLRLVGRSGADIYARKIQVLLHRGYLGLFWKALFLSNARWRF